MLHVTVSYKSAEEGCISKAVLGWQSARCKTSNASACCTGKCSKFFLNPNLCLTLLSSRIVSHDHDSLRESWIKRLPPASFKGTARKALDPKSQRQTWSPESLNHEPYKSQTATSKTSTPQQEEYHRQSEAKLRQVHYAVLEARNLKDSVYLGFGFIALDSEFHFGL